MNSQLKFGTISEAKPGFARVYFEEDEIVSDFWPVLGRTSLIDKESWVLNVDEHVVCLCDERCELGVVLGAIANEKDPVEPGASVGKFRKVFSDGTIIEYDKESHKLTADVKGAVDIISTTQLTAKAIVKASVEAPQIELKGTVTILGVLTAAGLSVTAMPGVPGSDGKITASADIETTGDIKAGTVSLKAHVHSGVVTGPGTSGPPVGA
ncbi:phage baseplate assembly protein V [Chitinophaga sp. CF418]|uniref:phage baseplate assembly protein V n=1 Tax=Chitinophaga sp. CF418 TaxID=1855287 RepID=UPI0009184B63|nr:phage baseplate assembly protein V [Chitinophaga sp. CF418]SHN45948.1 phage baseplate assembly protein V [Chitinophaga sp. CF418]